MSYALQRDIDLFVKLSEYLGLKLNISEWYVMSFSSNRCSLLVSGNSPYNSQKYVMKFVSVQFDQSVSVDI